MTARPPLQIILNDEAATGRLGAAIADVLHPGDCLALSGDLGVGKTALARAVIRSAMGAPCTVPSPTFTLAQRYDAPALRLWHFDLYRLAHPEEVVELGWEDALSEVVLVEWPERAGDYLPASAVRLDLAFGAAEGERVARIEAAPDWLGRFGERGLAV